MARCGWIRSISALVALAAPVAACPYCSLSQSSDTVIYILGFMFLPYLLVSGSLFAIRRVLSNEQKESV